MTDKTKKSEVVELTDTPKNKKVIGCDVGTMNIVCATQNVDGEIEIKTTRNMYLPVDKNQIPESDMGQINYVQSDDGIFIIGEDAFRFANIFGNPVCRPMSQGLISPDEIDGIDVLTLVMKQLVGETKNGYCVYSVPSPSVDVDNDIIYHQNVFGRIFRELGYDAKPCNESMGIIYSECQDDNFTALAFSYGDGMSNCFPGETEVRLLDGTKKTMYELYDEYKDGDNFWVFSSDDDGGIHPGNAHHIRKTRTTDKIARVYLDDGSVEECTPDHLWRLRDGSYKKAQNLLPDDSLMALHLRDNLKPLNGYTACFDKTGWKYVHRIVCAEFVGDIDKGSAVHHKNFNCVDNRPENLCVLTRKEHSALHCILADIARNRLKDKTYEEIYGIEKALDIKNKQSQAMKRIWNDHPDVFHNTIIEARKTGLFRRGKCFDDIFGIDKSNIIRKKMSECKIGKTFIDRFGEKRAREILDLQSENKKGVCGKFERTDEWKNKVCHTFFQKGHIPWCKGMSRSDYIKHVDVKSISDATKRQWNDPEKRRTILISKGMVVVNELKKRNLDITKSNYEKIRKTLQKNKYMPITWDKWSSYFSDNSELLETANNWNHRVVKVEIVDKVCDVFDFTVDKYHNFALGSGAFVHNCTLAYKGAPEIGRAHV